MEAEDDEEDEDLNEEDDEGEEEEDGSSDYEDAREEFDDPDAADLEADQKGHEDDEIDSDDAVGEADWEEFKKFANGRSKSTAKQSGHAKRPTAADFMGSGSEEGEEEEEGEEDEDEDEEEESDDEEGSSDDMRTGGFIDDEAEESDDDGLDLSGDEIRLSDDGSADDSEDNEDEDEDKGEEETDRKKKPKRSADTGIAASVREIMGEQSVVKSLLKTVDADVQKGKAVQRQRKGFDALLNVRIRLQKSVSWLCICGSHSIISHRETETKSLLTFAMCALIQFEHY